MSEESEPVLKVVKGEPTPAELAALVAVIAARSAATEAAGQDVPERRATDWASYWRNVRQPLRHGPDCWRTSAHPR